jgi:hypothetical protein
MAGDSILVSHASLPGFCLVRRKFGVASFYAAR